MTSLALNPIRSLSPHTPKPQASTTRHGAHLVHCLAEFYALPLSLGFNTFPPGHNEVVFCCTYLIPPQKKKHSQPSYAVPNGVVHCSAVTPTSAYIHHHFLCSIHHSPDPYPSQTASTQQLVLSHLSPDSTIRVRGGVCSLFLNQQKKRAHSSFQH